MAELDFNKIVKASMKLPVVTVSRTPFLRKELAPYYDEETINKVIEKGPRGIVDKKIIDRIANSCIKYQTTAVCAVSALAGLPGGWAMAGAIPADIAQFYGNAIALTEKLLYLYGWPDIMDDNGQVNDATSQVMILWLGVMMGAQGAEGAVRTVLKAISDSLGKRLANVALTRTAIYQLAKKICQWIGIRLTRDGFVKGAGKVIPLIGAPISAGVTYFTFNPMCRKLKKELDYEWNNMMI